MIFCPLVAGIELVERPSFLLFIAQLLLGLAAHLADLFFESIDAVAGRLALGDEFVGAVGIRLGIDAGLVDSRYFIVGDFRPRVRKGASQVGDFLLFLSDLFPRGVCRACCFFCCFSHAFSLL